LSASFFIPNLFPVAFFPNTRHARYETRLTTSLTGKMPPGFQDLPGPALSLTDAEKLRAADRAGSLGRRSLVLQSDGLGVLDLSLGPAFHTIRLHLRTSSSTLA
jgi:hypothetical protein